MGLMRWMRGGDENTAATSVVSAGLAEIDGLFRPSKHKQTEHVEESKRRRIDVANGADVDLERGVVVVRANKADEAEAGERGPATRTRTPFQPRPRHWWSWWTKPERRRRRARRRARELARNTAREII
jgi:hypothetical protein